MKIFSRSYFFKTTSCENIVVVADSLAAHFNIGATSELSLVSITANVTSRFLARGRQVFVSTTAAAPPPPPRTPEGGRVVLYVSGGGAVALRPWQNPTDRVNEL